MAISSIQPASAFVARTNNPKQVNLPRGVYNTYATCAYEIKDINDQIFPVPAGTSTILINDDISEISFVDQSLASQSWTERTLGHTGSSYAITSGDSGFVAITDDQDNPFFTSANGVEWEQSAVANPFYFANGEFEVIWTTSDNDTSTLTFPAGLQEDDLVIVAFSADGGIGDVPSGYTEISASNFASNSIAAHVSYKIMGATPDTNVTAAGLSGASVVAAVAIRGFDPTQNFISVEDANAASGGIPDPPPITFENSSGIYVGIGMQDDDNVTFTSSLDNFTTAKSITTGQSIGLGTAIAGYGETVDPGEFGGGGIATDTTYNVSIAIKAIQYDYLKTPAGARVTFLNGKYILTGLLNSVSYSDDLSSWTTTEIGKDYLSSLPELVYYSALGYEVQSSATIPLTLPATNAYQVSDEPVKEGDLVVVAFSTDASAAPITPDGYDLALNATISSSRLRVFTKVMGETPDSEVFIDFDGTRNTVAISLAIFRGVDTVSSIFRNDAVVTGSENFPFSTAAVAPHSILLAGLAVDSAEIGTSVTAGSVSNMTQLSSAMADTATADTAVVSALAYKSFYENQLFTPEDYVITPASSGSIGSSYQALLTSSGSFESKVIIFDGTNYVVAGTFGKIFTSSDLSTWTEIDSPFLADKTITAAAFDGTGYVFGGNDTYVYYTEDLVSWSVVDLAIPGTVKEINYDDVAETFVAATDAGVVYSYNGEDWVRGDRYSDIYVADKFFVDLGDAAPPSFDLPTSLQENDLVIFLAATERNDDIEIADVTWNRAGTYNAAGRSNAYFYKFMGATPDTSVSFTAGTIDTNSAVIGLVIKGIASDTLLDRSGTIGIDPGNTTLTNNAGNPAIAISSIVMNKLVTGDIYPPVEMSNIFVGQTALDGLTLAISWEYLGVADAGYNFGPFTLGSDTITTTESYVQNAFFEVDSGYVPPSIYTGVNSKDSLFIASKIDGDAEYSVNGRNWFVKNTVSVNDITDIALYDGKAYVLSTESELYEIGQAHYVIFRDRAQEVEL